MQNTTPIPVADGDLPRSTDDSRVSRPSSPRQPSRYYESRNVERTLIAEISEYESELGPIQTTGDCLCALRRAFDQNPFLVADASYSPNDYLEKALIAAVLADKLEIGKYLLDHGAQMDKPIQPLVHINPGSYAATNNTLPFLKLFIERGWDVNFNEYIGTALFHVVRDHESVTWLLTRGADPNLDCRENGMVFGACLLDMAALCSTVEVFNELIAHGARLEDSLALHHAAAARSHGPLGCYDTRLMTHLLELGVDINEPDDKGKPKSGVIGAPIFWAILRGEIANIKFLVENGADLSAKGPYISRTPLQEAKTLGYKEITEYLERVLPKCI